MKTAAIVIIPALLLGACASTEGANDITQTRLLSIAAMAEAMDLNANSDTDSLAGNATYRGIGTVVVDPANNNSFSATSETTLNANFDTDVINGKMTNWVDNDQNFETTGDFTLMNGTISGGAYNGQVFGTMTRSARTSPGNRTNLNTDPQNYTMNGTYTGTIHDSVDSDSAQFALGDMTGTTDAGAGTFDGSFATSRQ